MAARRYTFTTKDLAILTTIGSSCLCLVVLVLGVMYGLLTSRLPIEAIGTIQGASVGSGLLGFALILFMIIRVSLR